MNVKEIVEAHLKAHGYDGLWNADGECACKVGDLGREKAPQAYQPAISPKRRLGENPASRTDF